MDEIFGKAIPILQLVLPGFLATFIFYWLSDSPKPSQFERIVQALIGTVIIRFLVGETERIALWLGHYYSFGIWDAHSSDFASVGLATILGLGLAYVGNNDFLYAVSRKLNFTFRSAYGSDWRFAHRSLKERSVVLQFLDGRRLAGYPRAWPSDPEKGHYLMQFPTWIVEGKFQPAEGVSFLLIAAADVQWTEFLDLVEEDDADVEGQAENGQ